MTRSIRFSSGDDNSSGFSHAEWFRQVSICANNCTYVNAIGTVGNYHIGIYTRLLLMFLVDPLARPREPWMKRWIDMTRWIKARAPGGGSSLAPMSALQWEGKTG